MVSETHTFFFLALDTQTNQVKGTQMQTDTKTINTGAPQGTVLSPFLFTLYTNDCTTKGTHTSIIKFSDDTAIIDTSDSETEYGNEVSAFAEWCERHFLDLNVSKTKEMIIDMKRNKSNVNACMIKVLSHHSLKACYPYLTYIRLFPMLIPPDTTAPSKTKQKGERLFFL